MKRPERKPRVALRPYGSRMAWTVFYGKSEIPLPSYEAAQAWANQLGHDHLNWAQPERPARHRKECI